jgi:hypothetical protein
MKTREFEGKSIEDIIAKIEAEGEVFSSQRSSAAMAFGA